MSAPLGYGKRVGIFCTLQPHRWSQTNMRGKDGLISQNRTTRGKGVTANQVVTILMLGMS